MTTSDKPVKTPPATPLTGTAASVPAQAPPPDTALVAHPPMRLAARLTLGAVGLVGAASLAYVGRAILALPKLPDRSLLQVAIFACVAAVPQFWIEYTARLAENLAPEIPKEVRSRWFANTGAFVGLVERPLLLGSILAHHPEFIGVWLVFKGIAGYRLGLNGKDVLERRIFQLHLLNTASSLGGVALGWLVWSLLGLPTMAK
jgi:hypothetical protein